MIRWLLIFQKPHEVHSILAGFFQLSAGKMPHWYPYAITLNITRGSVTDFLPLEEYAAYSSFL